MIFLSFSTFYITTLYVIDIFCVDYINLILFDKTRSCKLIKLKFLMTFKGKILRKIYDLVVTIGEHKCGEITWTSTGCRIDSSVY